MVGVLSTREAIEMAEEASLDLIEISPNAVPPVAKISDYGKYKYEAQKKAHEARTKQEQRAGVIDRLLNEAHQQGDTPQVEDPQVKAIAPAK